jgi:hypothetical protein
MTQSHVQENRNLVDDMREKIKQFLAAQGMIKGTAGFGARHSEQPSKLRLTDGDYSSSSASPPTPVSVLSEELHPTLTISSERDEPYPSSLNSYRGGCPMSRCMVAL